MSKRPSLLNEAAGACGDLGTFIPHVIGAMTVAGLAPFGVLFGFGIALVASGLFYGMPMAVQPMKAVSAVMLTGQLTPGDVMATGLVIGVVLLVLGLTGGVAWLARLIPHSVTAGLQLGLGISMAILGFHLIGKPLWFGALALSTLLLFMWWRRFPAAPAAIIVAVIVGYAVGEISFPSVTFTVPSPTFSFPSWTEFLRAVELGVLPQLPLTLTNAIIVTAIIAREIFPEAGQVTERNLAVSTGLSNLLLAPFGAMPMCHGAGGLQAQYRFGARSGLAPIMFGSVLLVIALGFSTSAAAVFAAIPSAVVGALLLVAGTDLALTKRLFDAKPICWPAIGITAAASAFLNPAIGLVCGWLLELLRLGVEAALARRKKL